MIDLHTHTVFSDGELIPSELVRRAEILGYKAIGITDHVDFSNIEQALSAAQKAKYLEETLGIKVLAGVEITHVPPQKMEKLSTLARRLGAEVVVVHGETPVEPVRPGTNRTALEIGVDILAHPGFITLEEALLARENGVCLEITARLGHNITNGHVVRMAKAAGAKLLVNTDTHAPEDLINANRALEIAVGAGLECEEAERAMKDHPIVKI